MAESRRNKLQTTKLRHWRYACCRQLCYGIFILCLLLLIGTLFWYDTRASFLTMLVPGRHQPVKIILLAYMHTGSTFLGSVLHNHPGVYYEFEPLRSLETSYVKDKPLVFLDGTVRKLDSPRSYTLTGSETAWKYLTCNHQLLDVFTLSNHYFSLSDPLHNEDRGYYKCLLDREMQGMTSRLGLTKEKAQNIIKERTKILPAEFMNVTNEDIKYCLQNSDLRTNCLNAKVVMNKYIRMTMQMVHEILKTKSKPEEIKIIHLYRDPRAVLDSQVRRNNLNVTQFTKFVARAESMCKIMIEDYYLGELLKKIYPDTIYTLRYETMQESPLETIEALFEFLGLEFLDSDKEFVKKKAKEKTGLPRWRTHIDEKHLDVVDKYCYGVYHIFNYVSLDLKEVRDESNLDHLPE